MTFRPALTVPRSALRCTTPLPRPATLAKRWATFADEGGSVLSTLRFLKVAVEVGDERAVKVAVTTLEGLGLSPFLHVFGLVATSTGWEALPAFHQTLAACHVPVPEAALMGVAARMVCFAQVPPFAVVGGTGGSAAVTRAVNDLMEVVGDAPPLALLVAQAFTVLGRPVPADHLAKCYALVERFGSQPKATYPPAEA